MSGFSPRNAKRLEVKLRGVFLFFIFLLTCLRESRDGDKVERFVRLAIGDGDFSKRDFLFDGRVAVTRQL